MNDNAKKQSNQEGSCLTRLRAIDQDADVMAMMIDKDFILPLAGGTDIAEILQQVIKDHGLKNCRHLFQKLAELLAIGNESAPVDKNIRVINFFINTLLAAIDDIETILDDKHPAKLQFRQGLGTLSETFDELINKIKDLKSMPINQSEQVK